MLSSVILDVVLGLMLAFLAVSLIASAATECLASAFKWRSGTLLDGVKELLNDPNGIGLTKELYNHALVNPRASGVAAGADTASARPAYIEPVHFANALTEILDRTGKPVDRQLQLLLDGMAKRAGGDVQAMRTELAVWFDRAMDRVSGVYKRRTQLAAFMLALAIAAFLNVDALRIASHVWERQGIAAQLQPNMPTVLEAVRQLEELGLPIGWFDAKGSLVRPHARRDDGNGSWLSSILLALVGWLITAVASLFGAPFWFDSLQRIIRLRGTGPRPREQPAAPVAGVPSPAVDPPQLAAVGRR